MALPLYQKLIKVLKSVLEDSSKIKVFHDGRKDSLALHFLLGICPKACLDTAALHLFIEALKLYAECGDKLKKPKEMIRLIS